MTQPGTLHTSGPYAWTSDDGLWAVIPVSRLPPGCPRSKTRDTPLDAADATWDAGIPSTPGPKSAAKFVKVRVTDVMRGWGGRPPQQVVLRPSNFAASNRRVIPNYPGKCGVCGGGILVLFTSVEHEGGACPGAAAAAPKRRW